jgi:outer membrane protein TolC
MRTALVSGAFGFVVAASATFTSVTSHAQTAAPPGAPPAGAPVAPAGPRVPAAPAVRAPAAPAAAGAPATAGAAAPGATPGANDDVTPAPVPVDLLKVQPGGITADQAGGRAARTSWSAKAAQETLRGAAARVDAAWASFLPRLSGIAKYTRLSDFTPPSLSFYPPGLCPVFTQGVNGPIPPGTQLYGGCGGSGSLTFFVLDNWLLQATITVPISDYFLKIDQNYTAATRSADAARWDVTTARTLSAANGRVAYYTWMNARGAVIVAVQALNDQKTHLRDARNQFAVGNASKADVLRAETAVASAELALERAKNLADLSEKQLRVAVHAPEEEVIVPGEDLDSAIAPVQGNLKQMTAEALSARPEVKSADANAEAARQLASSSKAGMWPSLSAFVDGIEGNPNPRQIPPANTWLGTWDAGAQLTWNATDALVSSATASDNEARAAAIMANKQVTRDNIEVEVTQTLQGVHEADFSIESSTRELASAEEAYRVARELFNNGRATSTTLADAESDLTKARLDMLNAKVAARTARVRLDHALGRDAVTQP